MVSKGEFEMATSADLPQLVQLVNSAYRGEAARIGWSHEADLIEGNVRIDATSLADLILKRGNVILVNRDKEDIVGCVLLEKQEDKMYLGMLSVLPTKQARGTGKILLQQAEAYTLSQGINTIIMSVISIRHELMAWYKRRGYSDTGLRKPFPATDAFGIPKQNVEFAVLEKQLPLM